MQEKETEAVVEQRRRRKRISQMKNMIIGILGGWVVVSMLLIAVLFYMQMQLKSQIDAMAVNGVIVTGNTEQTSDTESDASVTEMSEVPLYSEEDDYVPATPVASGISEEENAASANDVHKVYLTFEDGPSEYTEEILDVLLEKNVKATFFVTGQDGEMADELYKRIVDEGHTLGMHTYSNKYSTLYQSEENFIEDITRLRAYLSGITGVEPIYYRFPGGSSNQITNVPMENLIHYLNEEGLVYYDWNISSGDTAANAYTVDEITANVIEDVVKYKTSVVLLHDGEDAGRTAEALSKLIDELQEIGAEVLPINEDTSVIQSVKADTIE